MGQHLKKSLKDKVVSIGFSALSGRFGRSQAQTKNIEQSSLEINLGFYPYREQDALAIWGAESFTSQFD